jgi:hypothetical protein
MAVVYTTPENKPFSSWIVSGKESEVIVKCVTSHEESKRCLKASSENMERIRKTLSNSK